MVLNALSVFFFEVMEKVANTKAITANFVLVCGADSF